MAVPHSTERRRRMNLRRRRVSKPTAMISPEVAAVAATAPPMKTLVSGSTVIVADSTMLAADIPTLVLGMEVVAGENSGDILQSPPLSPELVPREAPCRNVTGDDTAATATDTPTITRATVEGVSAANLNLSTTEKSASIDAVCCPVCSRAFHSDESEATRASHVEGCLGDAETAQALATASQTTPQKRTPPSPRSTSLSSRNPGTTESTTTTTGSGSPIVRIAGLSASQDRFFCSLCSKELSHMSRGTRIVHLNRCLDDVMIALEQSGPLPNFVSVTTDEGGDMFESGVRRSGRFSRSVSVHCPICNQGIGAGGGGSGGSSSTRSTILHLKRCARDNGVTTSELIELVRRNALLRISGDSDQ
eukprot:UC1_evm4s1574